MMPSTNNLNINQLSIGFPYHQPTSGLLMFTMGKGTDDHDDDDDDDDDADADDDDDDDDGGGGDGDDG